MIFFAALFNFLFNVFYFILIFCKHIANLVAEVDISDISNINYVF